MPLTKEQRSLSRKLQGAFWGNINTGRINLEMRLGKQVYDDLIAILFYDLGIKADSFHEKLYIESGGTVAFGGIPFRHDWGINSSEGYCIQSYEQDPVLVFDFFNDGRKWVPQKMIDDLGLSLAFQCSDDAYAPDFGPQTSFLGILDEDEI